MTFSHAFLFPASAIYLIRLSFDCPTSHGVPHLFIVIREIRDRVASRVKELRASHPSFRPHLVIIQAGDRPDSSTYVRMKAKACAEVDIRFTHIQLNASASVDEVIAEVEKLNTDESVSGILVQLPLGEHVSPEDERSVTEAVDPKKDVDGYVLLLIRAIFKTEA